MPSQARADAGGGSGCGVAGVVCWLAARGGGASGPAGCCSRLSMLHFFAASASSRQGATCGVQWVRQHAWERLGLKTRPSPSVLYPSLSLFQAEPRARRGAHRMYWEEAHPWCRGGEAPQEHPLLYEALPAVRSASAGSGAWSYLQRLAAATGLRQHFGQRGTLGLEVGVQGLVMGRLRCVPASATQRRRTCSTGGVCCGQHSCSAASIAASGGIKRACPKQVSRLSGPHQTASEVPRCRRPDV